MTLTELFTNIANAIRSKKNTSEPIKAVDFADEIENLPSGGGSENDYFTGSLVPGDSTRSLTYIYRQIKTIPLMTISGTSARYMFSGCSSLETIPELDTSEITNMQSMFKDCSSLKTIPKLNTSNVTSIDGIFSGCSSLETIPKLDIPKIRNILNMFNGCSSLKTIPELDISNVTEINQTFYGCSSLKTIPKLNTSKVTNMQMTFYNCIALESVPELDTSKATNVNRMFYKCSSLTNMEGLQNLGKAYTIKTTNSSNYTLDLSESTNLTRESLMNVINDLYDLNISYKVYDEEGNPGTGTLYTQSLQLGSTNIDKLTAEEIAIATAKGWTVS